MAATTVSARTGLTNGVSFGVQYTVPAAVTATETLATSNNTTYTKTLSNVVLSPTTTMVLYLNGTDQSITVGSPTVGVYPITGASVTTGSQYDSTTKDLTIVFGSANGPTDVVTISYSYQAVTDLVLDFGLDYYIVASIKMTSSTGVNKLLSDAVITYPAAGQLEIAVGASTFVFTAGDILEVTAQRRGAVLP